MSSEYEHDREEQIMDDVRTLDATVIGTFNIGGYSASEKSFAWKTLKARVEQQLEDA